MIVCFWNISDLIKDIELKLRAKQSDPFPSWGHILLCSPGNIAWISKVGCPIRLADITYYAERPKVGKAVNDTVLLSGIIFISPAVTFL